MENKKISPLWGDEEALIKLMNENFGKDALHPDWSSKHHKPIFEFVYERLIVPINGTAKFLCEPCSKKQERKFLFSKVSQWIEIGQLGQTSVG